jgi:DNA primase
MPYVPPEEKERIKREVSIERLAEARGIKLRRVGRSLMGLCPFHDDRNPSLSIDPVKNEWHCFGCDRKGDVIEWVRCAEGVSFHHALELLKRDYVPSTGPVVKQSTVPKLPCPVTLGVDDRTVMREVVAYYHRTLRETPEALRYIDKRGLNSSEMVARFQLGFSDRMLGPALPDKNRRPGAEIRAQLERLGVFRASGHEHLRGSLVVPVINLDGDVVEMYGRKINDNLRAGTDYHLYLPGPHRGVWNEEALIASKEIILCEALIDALTFWAAGYRQVTASYGVNGFTKDHRAAFERHGIKRVYIAYDHDDAGNRSAALLSEELMGRGIECFRVQFPKEQDANEYALKTKPAAKALGVLLTGAAWMGKGPRPAVSVPAPVAAPKPVAMPLLPAAPAAEELTAKEKIIVEETPEPMPEPTPKPEPQQQPQPAEPVREPIPAAVVSDPPKLDQPQQQRVFPLAVNAVPSDEPGARPMPMSAPAEPKVEIEGEEVRVIFGPRVYRVLGLQKNTSLGVMRVNVRVTGANARGEFCYHGDTLDMEMARQRMMFSKQAAYELGLKEEAMHREVGRLWTTLGDVQREQITKQLTAPAEEERMTDEEQTAAMDLLRDPRLMERVLADFERCGVVGEETNKTISYLAAVSRLMDMPLAIIVQSGSAAGKTSLMDAVLAFLPEEQRVQYSAMTGQALFYLGETELKHKVLAVVEEEGAQRAAYALKLLQSEGELTIASTGKESNTGRLITHHYRVEGPVMIFLTTTAVEMDEELLNRCIVLTVNEDPEQTKAIHRKQREAQTREGLWAREERRDILKLHRNAQRLLRPLHVANEHAPSLSFPYNRTRTRRDHMKFLTLINAIALLHQHQREIKRDTRNGRTLELIEATEADVEMARRLVNQVLPPSLDDLPPQTRHLLLMIERMARGECQRLGIERGEYRFTRRTVRLHTQWGDSVLKKHLHRLEELEYLIVHRGGRGQGYVYELDFETDEQGNPVVPGLGSSYDGNKSRSNDELSPGGHGQVAGVARVVTMAETRMDTDANGDFSGNGENEDIRGHAAAAPVVAKPTAARTVERGPHGAGDAQTQAGAEAGNSA